MPERPRGDSSSLNWHTEPVFIVGPFELILVLMISGLLCATVARSKGLRPVGPCLLGTFVPVVGLVVTLAMPSSRAQRPLGNRP